MNKSHQDARQVPVHLIEQPAAHVANGEELELISVSASSRDDRALISITNLDLEADTTVQLGLRGRPVNHVLARLLTADKPQAHKAQGTPMRWCPSRWTWSTRTESDRETAAPLLCHSRAPARAVTAAH
jgi:alpha-N-arabinofuranosidase